MNLINRTSVRKYLLQRCRDTRYWNPTQVSEKVLDMVEAKTRLMLQKAVEQHPTIGKTFKDIL